MSTIDKGTESCDNKPRFFEGVVSLKKRKSLLKMVLSALFLALGYIMPFLTGQIPEIGAMLCPMHIPVLLCGFFCGWQWGLAVGAITPLMRSMILGAPPMFPKAVCMAFELATYGMVAGFLYRKLPRKKLNIYLSLFGAMIVGRIVWGIAMAICLGATGSAFTFSAFVAGAFTNALPGIAVQIVLIPILVMLLDNPKIIDLRD